MKNRILQFVIILAALGFIGCGTKIKIVDTPYVFADKNASGTAAIILNDGVRLIDVDEERLPIPKNGTRWYPLKFPAGREFSLRVYVWYYTGEPGYRRRGIFTCPPLEAGKTYILWYEQTKNEYTGAGKLILTDNKVKELKYSVKGVPKYKQIYVQEIPPL